MHKGHTAGHRADQEGIRLAMGSWPKCGGIKQLALPANRAGGKALLRYKLRNPSSVPNNSRWSNRSVVGHTTSWSTPPPLCGLPPSELQT